jgi:hypothetical protein
VKYYDAHNNNNNNNSNDNNNNTEQQRLRRSYHDYIRHWQIIGIRHKLFNYPYSSYETITNNNKKKKKRKKKSHNPHLFISGDKKQSIQNNLRLLYHLQFR